MLVIHMIAAQGFDPGRGHCYRTACGIAGVRNSPGSSDARIIGGVGKGVEAVMPSAFDAYETIRMGRKYCSRCMRHYERGAFDCDVPPFVQASRAPTPAL